MEIFVRCLNFSANRKPRESISVITLKWVVHFNRTKQLKQASGGVA